MKKEVKGKIYWVLDDFNYTGIMVPKKDSTSHGVTTIENLIIEDRAISFLVPPFAFNGDIWSYNVSLSSEDGQKFTGRFAEVADSDFIVKVDCELFSNANGQMIFGNWIEDETIFTFWVAVSYV